MNNVWYGKLDNTPIDHLWVAISEKGLIAIKFRGSEEDFVTYVKKLTKLNPEPDSSKLEEPFRQLTAYLAGELKEFTLPICWDVMTDFQQTSLRHVYDIPYGKLCTYSDIAHALGNPKTIRAVGRANATNPIPLVIPCHRVIGSNGKLTGFGGGLETKAQLLRMEGSWLI
ncbi:MAG: methylated-DNA--[protein]-cysteine S-methyltransferase [Anaerolineae bacterium]